ncbi:PREDICTED: F-box/WD repeat-containing protein 12-like [Elephantulus edwardii]|uniref:F-box/WD repeat-containing protein 12-like n=1 Tax=Elephantulus edwardii TaxID=28737 RepID=UPI0003F0C030|nr:PREDICTED: F-box/WD repeat-containing protein 12-like [Elephantulus edwardii]
MERQFPDVVVLKILSFLDVQSLLQISQVNKQWHLLADNKKLWKTLCLKRWNFCSFSDEQLGTKTWKQFFLNQVGQEHLMTFTRPQDFACRQLEDRGRLKFIAYLSGSGISVDGQEKSIICGVSIRQILCAWDVLKGTLIWESPIQLCCIICMTTLCQRHLAFTLDSDNTVKVWNCQDTDALAAVTMSKRGVTMETILTKAGPFLVVGDCVGDIYTFTVPELKSVSRVHAFSHEVDRLLCSPDKRYIFASRFKGHICPKEIASFRLPDRMTTPTYVGSSNGSTVIFVNDKHLFLYTIDGNMLYDFQDHKDKICHLWVDPVRALTTSMDHSVNIYLWQKDDHFPYLTHCCTLKCGPIGVTSRCFATKTMCDNRTLVSLVARNNYSSNLLVYSLR